MTKTPVYRFGKSRQIEVEKKDESAKVIVYINSNYDSKEEIKQLGGKYDYNGLKKWYFEYDIEDFKKHKKGYTYQFPPHSVNIKGEYNFKRSKSETEQVCLNECKDRWIKQFQRN